MGYAETQDEIIRARLAGRPPAVPQPTRVEVTPAVHFTPVAARQPAVDPHAAVASASTRSVAAPAADGWAAADLEAAVAAARRLRHMAEVEQIVGAAGITAEQLRGHDRRRELVEVRRIVAVYLRRRGCTLLEIGRVLNRDHTSVLNLLRTRAPVVGPPEELAS